MNSLRTLLTKLATHPLALLLLFVIVFLARAYRFLVLRLSRFCSLKASTS